ncbi:MAG: beta-lactamase family protein [Oscillospiraceae bacterium]|nr:beta-lactamase family protein [Oscillospiraceae bacterium]
MTNMKYLLKRLAAVFCGAAVMLSSGMSVYADEDTASDPNDKLVLPSGITLEIMKRELDPNLLEFASAEVGVFSGGEVIYTGYFGYTDVENKKPADENSVYEWGSISKTLVWVSAMQLYEQGKLDLYRDIREYLPEGFFRHLSYDEPITMMNLMDHNAGWQETMRPIFKTDENAVRSLGEELQAIEPAQIHRPGEVIAYSNYGAALAGYVIECITGQDYCEYVHENIFDVLGMEHTSLSPAHSDNTWVKDKRGRMKSYRFVLGNLVDLGNRLDYIGAYPAGSATGTLSDLMTYAMALADSDAPLFRKKETAELMFTGTQFYGDSDIPMSAHGFWFEEHNVRTLGHSGATTAGQANMIFDPVSGTGLVVMVNEPDGNWFLDYTPTYVFGEMPADKYVSEEPQDKKIDGVYTTARNVYTGMMKYIPYISAVPASAFGETESIGNGLYRIKHESLLLPIDVSGNVPAESAMIFGTRILPDGRTVIEQPSCDLICDNTYLAKLCLITAYMLLAVMSVFMLLIRMKYKKHGRLTAYNGQNVLSAGQLAQTVSVITFLSVYAVFSESMGGLPFTAGAVIGIIQIICTAVCAAAAVYSAYALIKQKGRSLRFAAGFICNALMITAVVYFEMYKFTDI